jgi:hypothetical protein
MIQAIGAPRGFTSFDWRGLSRRIIIHTAPGTAALALGALVGVWIIHTLSDSAPKFAKAPLMASAASVSGLASPATFAPPKPAPGPKSANSLKTASKLAANPYGALVDPGFSVGSTPAAPPQTLTQAMAVGSRPAATNLALAEPSSVAPAPRPEVSTTAQDIPLPAPKPEVSEIAQDTPLPPPRPMEIATAPASAQAPVRLLTQRNARAGRPVTAVDNRGFFEKLFGLGQSSGPALAYAPAKSGAIETLRSGAVAAVRNGNVSIARTESAIAPTGYDRYTAIYDIAAHTVYLPNGTRLEAHSGLGDRLDDPHHVSERNRGATPPHVYALEPREESFHGVQALRLTPVGGGDIFGRAGLLAHSYMLGPNGDSNGCVSFKDYDAFLKAYQNGQVKRLAVVARVN